MKGVGVDKSSKDRDREGGGKIVNREKGRESKYQFEYWSTLHSKQSRNLTLVYKDKRIQIQANKSLYLKYKGSLYGVMVIEVG